MTKTLMNFLEDIRVDHPTYSFPVSSFQRDLTDLYFSQHNFDNIIAGIVIKLSRKHGKIITHIFFLCLDKVYPNQLSNIEELDPDEYFNKIEEFIDLLGRIRITRIPKNSPDGLMLSEMS